MQEPLDTNLYEHNPVCDKCETGGTLICCDFCNVFYHATCIPGMRAHVPDAGFVCEEYHAQSFPDRQQEYAYIFAGRVLRVKHVNSPVSPSPANDVSADAVTDARVERSLQDATDLVADAPATWASSSTLVRVCLLPLDLAFFVVSAPPPGSTLSPLSFLVLGQLMVAVGRSTIAVLRPIKTILIGRVGRSGHGPGRVARPSK
jgi:hypothetical protein